MTSQLMDRRTMPASSLRSLLKTAAASALLCAALLGSAQARVIDNPDTETIGQLAAFLAGNTPNFREDALASREYRRANEFDKPEVLDTVEARLRSEYEGMADIEGINLRVSGNIGQYDAAAGVYRISVFAPGVYFPFRPYALILDNAEAFHEWELPIAEAQRIRELSPSGRVTIEMQVRPFGVGPDDQREVRTQIVEMRMFEQSSGQLLHEISLPAEEYRAIANSEAAQIRMMDNETLELLGIRFGMSMEEVEAILADEGFETSVRGFGNLLLFTTAGQEILEAEGHFGDELDCEDGTRLHRCGIVRFEMSNSDFIVHGVTSVVLMQSAVDTSKQDVVNALFNQFGPASDRFSERLWGSYAVDQYVWGGFTKSNLIPARGLTRLSGSRHWQVEAVIAEPESDRKVVIVQINLVEGEDAVTGGGGIEF